MLGTIVLVKEDVPTRFHSVFQRYFAAEGVAHKHKVVCVGSPSDFDSLSSLPHDVSTEPMSSSSAAENASIVTVRTCTGESTVIYAKRRALHSLRSKALHAEDLKIAWRYQQRDAMSALPQPKPSPSSASTASGTGMVDLQALVAMCCVLCRKVGLGDGELSDSGHVLCCLLLRI